MSVSVAFDKVRRVILSIDCAADQEAFFFYRLFCGNDQRYRAAGAFSTASTLFTEVSLALSKFVEDELTFIGRAQMTRAEALAEIEKQFELCVCYTDSEGRYNVVTSTDDPFRHAKLLADAPQNAKIANSMISALASSSASIRMRSL